MSYAETYTFCCIEAIKAVQERLGRDLTPSEQRRIWNTGSLMMLESVEQGFMADKTPVDLEAHLRSMEEWTEARFQKALATLLERLPEWLGRSATEPEHAALAQSEHIGVLMRLGESLAAAQPDQREALLRQTLFSG